jgi:hypothetical protein
MYGASASDVWKVGMRDSMECISCVVRDFDGIPIEFTHLQLPRYSLAGPIPLSGIHRMMTDARTGLLSDHLET